MRKIVYFVIIVGVLLGCGERQEYREALSRAEAVMNDHPDSALLILDSLGQHEKEFGRHFRMQYLLHRTNAENKTDVKFTTDSLAKELVDHFDNHGTINERVLAHYLLGRALSDMGEAPTALQSYYDAIDCADTTRTDFDFITLSRVYAQMAQIFHLQNLPHDEIWALQHFIALTEITSSKLDVVIAKSQLIRPYYLLDEKDTVLQIIDNKYNTLKNLGYGNEAVSSFGTSIYIYLERGELRKAQQLLNIFEHESGLFDDNGNIAKGREGYYFIKGFYEIAVHKMDSAEFYFRKAIQYGYRHEGYKGLLYVYKERRSLDSIVHFANLYEAAQDTLHNRMQTDAIHKMASLYNYSRSQKEAEQEREKTRETREILAVFILFAFLLIAVISWIYFRKQQKKKQKIRQLESDLRKAMLTRREVQEELKQLKAQNYESVVAAKEKKECELTHIIERLKVENDLYKKKERNTDTDQLESFYNSNIAQLFIKKANGKTERPIPSDAEWRLLESQFAKDMPVIYKSFGSGEALSAMEQHVCILILLKIPTYNIINMVNSSPQTVSKAKSRANMKLFNEKRANSLENNLFSALKRP